MFAIAVNSQVQLDKIDEATAIFHDSVTPAYQQGKCKSKEKSKAYLLIEIKQATSLEGTACMIPQGRQM